MFYINQYDYAHMEYPHPEGVYTDKIPTVATSGCGLCSFMMIVNNRTNHTITLEKSLALALESGANSGRGTKLRVMAPYAAPLYGLEYHATRDAQELRAHLEKGEWAVICCDGDTDRGIGLFSHVAHFVVACGIQGDEICILDPAYKEDKFEEGTRQSKVRVDYPYLYCAFQDLVNDTLNKKAPFSLFTPKR